MKAVAATAHDVRTPLSALHSGTNVLASTLRKAQKQNVDIAPDFLLSVVTQMEQATQVGLDILNAMNLRVSILAGETVTKELKTVDVQTLISSAVSCVKLAQGACCAECAAPSTFCALSSVLCLLLRAVAASYVANALLCCIAAASAS